MFKKRAVTLLLVIVAGCFLFCSPAKAAPINPTDILFPTVTVSSFPKEATKTAEATEAATIVEKVVEKKPDITEPKPETLGKLEKYLAENPPEPLTVTNFLQHAIREAVKRGVPANTIVLILLFPIVAALIAASRHLIGVRGLGIFLPAVLSVVFVATGIIVGVMLFLTILIVATGGRIIMRRLRLQYMPRMALLLWFVALGVLAVLLISPVLNLEALTAISIFPILMLVLLAEQFIGLQVGKGMKEASELSFETVMIALAGSLLLNLEFLQKFVLLHPELTIALIALFDIFMGKYVGLRLLEKKKFKQLLK